MQIGRRIYYESQTGIYITDTGERQGEGTVVNTSIEEDLAFYPSLQERNLENTSYIELSYGERSEEFLNMGSMIVDPATKVLTIHPRLTATIDKNTILANGIDTATITVTTQGNEIVTFVVGITDYPMTPTNGVTVFRFSSEVTGQYIIEIKSGKYGASSVIVEVI